MFQLIRSLTIAVFVVGCVPLHEADTPLPALDGEPTDSSTHHAQTLADLEALRALGWFEVVGMVGHESDPFDEEQARRLQTLVHLAQTLPDDYVCYTTALSVVDDSLNRLQGLDIIEIGGMFMDLPSDDPGCDDPPCAADIAEAERTNEQRALQIYGLSQQAQHL